jgi:hypothetical protein
MPAEYRSKFTWRHLAGLLKRAAEGQQDVAEVSTALRIVLQLGRRGSMMNDLFREAARQSALRWLPRTVSRDHGSKRLFWKKSMNSGGPNRTCRPGRKRSAD